MLDEGKGAIWNRGAARLFAPVVAAWMGEGLRGRLARGVVWSTIGTGIAQSLTLLATIPIGRMLGATSYGELGIVQSTLATFAVFAGPTLGLTATKYLAEFRDTDSGKAARILALARRAAIGASALFAGALFLAAPLLSRTALDAPDLATQLRLGTLTLFLNGVDGYQRGALAGFESFRTIAWINIVRGVIALPVMVGLTWTYGLTGAVTGLAISAAVACLGNAIALRHELRKRGFPNPRAVWTEWRTLTEFSLPALVGACVAMPAVWASNALLVNRSAGYQQFGIFTAANNWRTAILFLPSVINQPFLSVLANLFGLRDFAAFRRVLLANVAATLLTALAAALPIALLAGPIMRSYGPAFAGGRMVLVLLALASVIMCAVSAIGSAIWSGGRMWQGAVLNFIWAGALLGTLAVTVRWGALGLALAWVAAALVHLLCVGAYVLVLLRRVVSRSVLLSHTTASLSHASHDR